MPVILRQRSGLFRIEAGVYLAAVLTVISVSMFGVGADTVLVPQEDPVGAGAIAPPVISSFVPDRAQVAMVVTITGSNFSDAQSVAFNGVSSRFRVAADNTIYATVPTGITTGPVSVSNLTGTGTSAANFNLVPSPPVLVGAGDIARCSSAEEATATLLDAIAGTVITTGDNAYLDGTEAEFNDCYDPTWGRHKARTRPTSGNHDYNTPGASGYYNYFGPAAGEPDKGYYSYDVGNWHIIALNSECAEIGGCDADSPQGQWLQADLAENPSACTLAYWHRPLFCSCTNGGNASFTDFWQILYDAGAELVINGHDHDYERFAPQDANGVADPLRGIREFVVGTGGTYLYPIGDPLPNSEISNSDAHGVLKLTLNPASYDWEFVPIAGQAFTDSGSGLCHQGNQAPTVEAGPDQVITWPDSALLDGNALDDGLPDPPGILSTTWSQISGPGSASFVNSAAVDTTVSFSQIGDYVLRLSVDDGEFIVADDVNIVVTDATNAEPTVSITVPANGSSFVEDESIGFSGNANDAEDGDLSANLVWSSSLDGVLGNGASVTTALSVGGHVVTASVTDSGGASAAAQIDLTVTAPANTAPTVGILGPADGASFVEDESIGFSGNANDAEDGDLSANLVWSSSLDGVLGNGASVTTALSVGGHVVTASVTDSGGASAAAQIDLTVTAPANTAPTVGILGPADGASFVEDESIGFSGNANDAEDGDLSANLVWSSSLDGVLGNGASVTTALSVGSHVVTASVTDSGGASAAAQIDLTVTAPANTAPTVGILGPADGASFVEDESIGFSGNANDAEDGDLSANLVWSSSLDGVLGNGALVTTALSVGSHVVTASVTDSGGASAAAQIDLTVTASIITEVTPNDPGGGGAPAPLLITLLGGVVLRRYLIGRC